MSTVELDIANMAISHLGFGKEIANLTTEKSAEANACRRFIDFARQACLRDFHWGHSLEIAALSLVENDPNSEWKFSYRYPSDCLDFIRILSGTRNDGRHTRVPYRTARDNSGRLIFTDKEDAYAEYTKDTDDPSKYPPDFNLAWSYRLAHYIVPRVTGESNRKLKKEMFDYYMYELSMAKANAANEDQPDVEPDGELIQARNGALTEADRWT